MDELLARLDMSSLPVSATVDTGDIADIVGLLAVDPGLQQALRVATQLRNTLMALDLAPTDAVCALGFAIGLIGRHDMDETPAESLLHASVPVVLGNLNTRTTPATTN